MKIIKTLVFLAIAGGFVWLMNHALDARNDAWETASVCRQDRSDYGHDSKTGVAVTRLNFTLCRDFVKD